MTDRVYPSAKPAAAPTFPAPKSQQYGANRPLYRPEPKRDNHRRGCCCRCCLWTTIAVLILILLVAVAAIALYVIYRPHRPTFTVSSLKVSALNLTSSTLISTIAINITAKNPNKNLVFTYDPISISVQTEDGGIDIGDGSLPGFLHGKKNTTLLKLAVRSAGGGQQLEDSDATKLKNALKSRNGAALKIELDTKVKAKMGGMKSPKVGIRVTCKGIRATAPTGKTAATASTAKAKCKVDSRIKIWRWTF